MNESDSVFVMVKLFSSQGECLHSAPKVEESDNLFDLVHVFRQFSREVNGGELHRLVFQAPVHFQNTFTTSFSGRLYDWKEHEKEAIQVVFDNTSPVYIIVKASLSLSVDKLNRLVDDIQQCFRKFHKQTMQEQNNTFLEENTSQLPELVKQMVTELTTKVSSQVFKS
ncbi:hypothetical protein GpartN1_g5580.t1 [Galdieria partita]|uniref:Uncharacterized protein n=1 Tax=Galdieria partita TaxID=83374 RepID=A0A9C7Q0Y3_9RHOD|nr:hypothetical protein GpartN1_g5580.t1 [Galdieria partita]